MVEAPYSSGTCAVAGASTYNIRGIHDVFAGTHLCLSELNGQTPPPPKPAGEQGGARGNPPPNPLLKKISQYCLRSRVSIVIHGRRSEGSS